GKRSRLEEFPLRGRGGQGVIAMQTSERNGSLVAAMQVYSTDEMMLITDRGTLVRTRVEEVSITSRNTQGVMLIRLGNDEKLVKTVRIDELVDASTEAGDAETDTRVDADDAIDGGDDSGVEGDDEKA
ncbi:MAG: DNA gyrase C-terminal beta-propeller domain-containing protein, partial [Pseudomonadota bacterium]